jgi:hypothetical protein
MKIVWTCDFRAVSKAIQEAAEPRKFHIQSLGSDSSKLASAFSAVLLWFCRIFHLKPIWGMLSRCDPR